MVHSGDQGGSQSSGLKLSPSLPPIPEARNARQEAGSAEQLGLPVQVVVSVDLVDQEKAEDAISPALPVPVSLNVSSVVPTVTSETVSAITTITTSSNNVYEIFKQAQIDKSQANMAQQHPMGKGDNFIQISQIMAKRNRP